MIILNQSSDPRSYLSGVVTVSALSSTTILSQHVYTVARDPQLISDAANGVVNVSDGVTEYSWTGAVIYLREVAAFIAGSVVGLAGSAAPSYQTTVGGKDPSAKSQPLRMNQFADTSVNFRNSYLNITGNTTSVVKSGSGTLHGIMINHDYSGGTIEVFDNTAASGTTIATIQVGTPSGGLLSTSGKQPPQFLGPLGLEFTTGLTVKTSGSASNDITVLYQ